MKLNREELTAARMQALSISIGLFTFVAVGVAACLALVAGVFYLVVSFVLLVLRAASEVFSGIASVWTGADSLLKLIILVLLAYGGYHLYQSRTAKRKGASLCYSGSSS